MNTIHNLNPPTATNNMGFPPIPPKAHQKAVVEKQIYDREEAFIDVSETASAMGFQCPVVFTKSAWMACVFWDDEANKRKGVVQNYRGRLQYALFLAGVKARATGSAHFVFEVDQIPYEGNICWSVAIPLVYDLQIGDNGDTMITIG